MRLRAKRRPRAVKASSAVSGGCWLAGNQWQWLAERGAASVVKIGGMQDGCRRLQDGLGLGVVMVDGSRLDQDWISD